jgi:hypothetical protein
MEMARLMFARGGAGVRIEMVIVDRGQKALVAKVAREFLPGVGMVEISRRVEKGEVLFGSKMYQLDHDEVARTLWALCEVLDARGVAYRMVQRLEQVSLAGEPARDVVEQIDKAGLRKRLGMFEEIRAEERRISELEG